MIGKGNSSCRITSYNVCYTKLLRAGSFFTVIGPNGSGKTTLLRLLLGALRPAAGHVRFLSRNVAEWPRAELARRIGVVTQHEEFPFPITVREMVAMGRYPHLGSLSGEGPNDKAAIAAALDACDVTGLAERDVTTLSGGEFQRARIARALAQEPRALVLDEPTASLDIRHEMGRITSYNVCYTKLLREDRAHRGRPREAQPSAESSRARDRRAPRDGSYNFV